MDLAAEKSDNSEKGAKEAATKVTREPSVGVSGTVQGEIENGVNGAPAEAATKSSPEQFQRERLNSGSTETLSSDASLKPKSSATGSKEGLSEDIKSGSTSESSATIDVSSLSKSTDVRSFPECDVGSLQPAECRSAVHQKDITQEVRAVESDDDDSDEEETDTPTPTEAAGPTAPPARTEQMETVASPQRLRRADSIDDEHPLDYQRQKWCTRFVIILTAVLIALVILVILWHHGYMSRNAIHIIGGVIGIILILIIYAIFLAYRKGKSYRLLPVRRDNDESPAEAETHQ